MIRDMRHRSGNLFSQLLALFSQTARTSKSIADLASKYQARVLAMANAHRLITEGGWKSIPIMELHLRRARAVHRPGVARRSESSISNRTRCSI